MILTPSSQQQETYRLAFVHNCLLLLVRARRELASVPLADAEEPVITGLLAKRANELTEMGDAEQWLEDLVILDDPPQNDERVRLGKARHRIDIEFVETRKGRRPRFHVEAKRLDRPDSVSEYFGDGGLGMFLVGAYASEWPSAGMLGYVQTKDRSHWQAAISKKLELKTSELNQCTDRPGLRNAGWRMEGLTEVYESCHERVPEALGRIGVYHLLLEFC